MITDFVFIAVLILANGFFAASEMAIVSVRQIRLQARAEDGDTRARRALNLREHPAEFLATVQVGITLVATLASAVGGVEAARRLGPFFARIPAISAYADQLALGLVVLVITYASLLFGELVPKRLAIRNPERLATAIVGFFEFLIRFLKWPIRFLLTSADVVLGIFGEADSDEETASPEEIEILVHRSAAEGVILPIQERMIARVFDYADRSTRDEMTPRTEIVSLEADIPIKSALKIAKRAGFSRYPIIENDVDHILGYIHIKDLMWADSDDHLTEHLRPAVFIPEGVSLPQVFTTLTRAGRQLGIVVDEYGGTEGLITLENVLEVIVGEIEDEHSPVAAVPQQVTDGTWRIAGSESITEVADLLGLEIDHQGKFSTLGGFITAELANFPKVGDSVRYGDYSFEVDEIERFRVVTVCVKYLPAAHFE